eukprot:TRINITY_DN3798_c0_g2_i1.p1 TRINITY_DN3798_c0_g2~~TRINITY_DN3798_c0_g2_i1.p1  ORF type:complete len:564 (-),score=86.91 TRINITY_DN3798_c0_g2_i1:157-1848(-)
MSSMSCDASPNIHHILAQFSTAQQNLESHVLAARQLTTHLSQLRDEHARLVALLSNTESHEGITENHGDQPSKSDNVCSSTGRVERPASIIGIGEEEVVWRGASGPYSGSFNDDAGASFQLERRGRHARIAKIAHARLNSRSISVTTANSADSRATPKQRHQGRVFADVESLKERTKKALVEGAYDVTNLYTQTGCFQFLARSWTFEHVSSFMVLVSSAWIAFDVDLNPEMVISDADLLFQAFAHLFCVYFVSELLIRFMAFERKLDAPKDPYFLFDLLLVVLMVFEAWIIPLTMLVPGMRLEAGNLRVLGLFRAMRLLRLLRLARVLRAIPELLVIVRGILIAFRALLVVLALLGFMIYIGGVFFRVLLEGTEIGAARFNNVPTAMGTLLLEGTLSGDKGGAVMREAHMESFTYSALFFVFVLFANITLMGVLGGLLVQTVKTVAEIEKEEAAVRHALSAMDMLWKQVVEYDDDNDGFISPDELETLMMDDGVTRSLGSIGVDLEGLLNVSEFIFEQHGGRLSKPEFCKMVLGLRGKEIAKVKDHVETRKFVHAQLQLHLRQ